jgi:histone H2A
LEDACHNLNNDSGLETLNKERENSNEMGVPTAPPNSPDLDTAPVDGSLKTPQNSNSNHGSNNEFVGGVYKSTENTTETIENIKAFVEKPITRPHQPKPAAARKLDLNQMKEITTTGSVTVDVEKIRNRPKKKRVSLTRKSGLVFPVARVLKHLKKGKFAKHVGVGAGVYLTAVLEYLVAEVLELAGNCARYYKKRRVFPRCVLLTFRHDAELDVLTRQAVVPQGGVKPFIHRELLPVDKQESHFHPKFGGFISTQDMIRYKLKPPSVASATSNASYAAKPLE